MNVSVHAINRVGGFFLIALTLTFMTGCGSVSPSKKSSATRYSLVASPTSLSFGNATVSTSISREVTLTNNGTGAVKLSGVSVSGAGFSASGMTSGTSLEPNEVAKLSVTFAPSSFGNTIGSIAITSNAPAVSVALSGSGAGISASAAGAPACGINNNQDAVILSNYDTFTPPPVGDSYIDPFTGCTITRITDSVADNAGYAVYYSSISAINANGDYILVTNTFNGGWILKAGTNLSGVKPGTTIIADFPNQCRWDISNPLVCYYIEHSSVKKYTLSGSCTSSSNCPINKSTIASISGYSSTNMPDEADISQDGTTLFFIGYNSNGTMDLNTFNLNTLSVTNWYTTQCAGSPGTQPGCIHKTQLSALGEPIVTYPNNGSSGESGTVWYHAASGVMTQTHLQNNTSHLDSGLDINGNSIFLQDRLDKSVGQDACPDRQWSGSIGGGGSDMSSPSAPASGTCVFNKNWASPHISYRGGPGQPWFTISFFDTRSPGPEFFTTDGNYVPPTCTQEHTTTSGTCWYPHEAEVDMVNISTNMNAAGSGPLGAVYRMAQARSRTEENLWVQITATMSHNGAFIAFNSNMAHVSGCSSNIQGNTGCGDVYIISAAGGAPLF